MFAIWRSATETFYHPDHEAAAWPDALLFDDLGEAGMVADQLNDRDRWTVVTVGINGLVKLGESPWEVVDQPRSS